MNKEQINLALSKNRETHLQFALIDDINSLYQKAIGIISNANAEKMKLKSMYSDALIILNQNIPAQVDNGIKTAKDLGANDIAEKLNKLKAEAKNKEKEIMPIYNFLK